MDKIAFPNLGLEFTVDKIAFSIFGIEIAWYAIIIVFGLFIAWIIATRNAKTISLDVEKFSDVIIYMVIAGIIGARAYYVMFNFDLYRSDLLSIFNLREGGIAIYGGVIGGAIAIYIYTKLRKESFLNYTDCIVPGLVLAQAIGRWGNFVNQEAYGYETNSLFAMEIFNGVDRVLVHPTFLYESVWNLMCFGILMVFFKKFRKNKGEVGALYFITYGIGRFFIEGMRTDSLYIGSLRVSQVLSLILVITGIVYFICTRVIKINKKTTSQV